MTTEINDNAQDTLDVHSFLNGVIKTTCDYFAKAGASSGEIVLLDSAGAKIALPLAITMDVINDESIPQAIVSQVAAMLAASAVFALAVPAGATAGVVVAGAVLAGGVAMGTDALVDLAWGGLFPDAEAATGGDGGAAGNAANAGSAGATLAPPPRRRDPLVLDLDGDGLEFTNLADSQAMFDLSGDQFATRTAWLKGDDGFLVLDGNGDGVVNGIDELFGSATEGGFTELSTWDANADGRIDVGDAIFADLKIWRDLNGDGVSQAEELKSLADHNIQSINLTTTALANPVTDAQVVATGTFTRTDGTTGQVGDVLFATNARAQGQDLQRCRI